MQRPGQNLPHPPGASQHLSYPMMAIYLFPTSVLCNLKREEAAVYNINSLLS